MASNRTARMVPGITLRDWFATHAMEAWIIAYGGNHPPEWYAERAYEMADKMVDQRKVSKG